jgi:hypothetical protein
MDLASLCVGSKHNVDVVGERVHDEEDDWVDWLASFSNNDEAFSILSLYSARMDCHANLAHVFSSGRLVSTASIMHSAKAS